MFTVFHRDNRNKRVWFPLTQVAMNIFRNLQYIQTALMEEAHGKECRGEPIAMLRTSPARTHPTLSTGEAVLSSIQSLARGTGTESSLVHPTGI
jgi:hypothetical protein